jgi:hypothetical protein
MSDSASQITKLLVPVAQVVGLTTSGFLTGKYDIHYTFPTVLTQSLIGFGYAFSFASVPVILKTCPPDLLVKQWKMSYEIGKATAPPMAVVSAICFGFLATQCTSIPHFRHKSITIHI